MDDQGWFRQADLDGVEPAAVRRPRTAAARFALCSPERPWGVHAPLTSPACPRCGWDPDTFAARKSARTPI